MSAHRSRKKMFRTLTAVAASAATVLVTAGASTAADDPDPRVAAPSDPTGIAERAEIHRAGQAYMGWHADRQVTPTKTEVAPAAAADAAAATVTGIDVSGHQGDVDWSGQYNAGIRFAYVKATEGTYYENEYFGQQYNGSYDVGMVRGAYHFATPNTTDGATQANYFVDNGGGWSGDGKTLPGALDIEYNPYGDTCYGLSQDDMVGWISDFVSTYKERTGRDPVIYTTYDWWSTCTGNSDAFSGGSPLWIARYADSAGTLPGGWGFYTFWQYTDSPLDTNVFNGDESRLAALATG